MVEFHTGLYELPTPKHWPYSSLQLTHSRYYLTFWESQESFYISLSLEREGSGVCLEEQDKLLCSELPSPSFSLSWVSAIHQCLLPLFSSSSLWLYRAYVSVVPWWAGGLATTAGWGRSVTHALPESSESDLGWAAPGASLGQEAGYVCRRWTEHTWSQRG